MSLDLGALVGRVVLEDVEFQRTYSRVVGQMRAGAGEAERAAAATTTLDRAFTGTAASAGTAAGNVDRAAKAATGSATAAERAAAAETRRAEAVARVAAIMGPLADATTREQTATLRMAAAQERANIAAGQGSAEFARLASAQASAIAASDRAAAAANATSRWQVAMAGALRTAGQLGLVFGAFEAVKAAIDIGHEAADFQRQMLQIQTMAGASAADVRDLSAAVLAMAGDVAAKPDELAKALYHIEQNGRGLLTTAQMLDALRVGAEGAKIGLADVEDTTNAMTIALASGIKGVGNLQQAMGFMLATVGTGDMRLRDLTAALSTGILSIAKGFGASLQDVSAVLATLGDNGIRSNEAAQALRQTLMGFAQPARGGAKALDEIGLKLTDLRDTMQKHGLVAAMDQLQQHMTAAGITGSKVGAFITEAFGRRAGAGIAVLMGEVDRVNLKFAEAQRGAATFASKWEATTHTAGFALDQLGARAQATGIQLATGALPVITAIVTAVAHGIPEAVHAASVVLTPFGDAWHYVAEAAGPVGHALADVLRFAAPVAPVLEDVAAGALAMWAAFKGYQIARAAVLGMGDLFAALQLKAVNAYTAAQTSLGKLDDAQIAAARTAELSSLQQQAAADAAAAAQARATAVKAQALSDEVAASTAATDEEVANADRLAAAAWAQAKAAQEAAAASASAAETAAADIDTAGTAAAAGWRSVLGPLGLAAIGIMTVVSMLGRSESASKSAAAAAKAYADAFSSGGSGSTIIDTITSQLSANGLPRLITQLNKELSGTKLSGQQFVDAIAQGGPALDALKAHLQGIVEQGTHMAHGVFGDPHNGWLRYLQIGANSYKELTPAAQQAAKALHILTEQHLELSDAAQKDLEQTQSFAGVASSVDKVSASAQVASDTAKQYAQMMGIAVDKNGIAAVSSTTLANAVHTVQVAYNTATGAGAAFLDSLQKFSGSAGTAADRAAVIGATLKAANGDALSYAGALAGTTAAVSSLTDAFAQQRQQLAQQSADQQKALDAEVKAGRGQESANARVTAAQARLDQVRANAKSTAAQLARAESALTSARNSAANAADKSSAAQANANKVGALSYADTEAAAVKFTKTAQGLTASIDTAAKGAPALVQQLQGIQDAAMQAAEAMFQHEVATKGSKQAADDAYRLYVTETQGQLIDQAGKLGWNATQAKALADQFFGIPKDVKTLIEAEGTDPIVNVLNQIGEQLSYLTHEPWVPTVNLNDKASPKIDHIQTKLQMLGGTYSATVVVNETAGTKHIVGVKNAYGAIISTPTLLAPGQIGGEAGREAIVPLDQPLDRVNPSVRWLAAVAQGKPLSAPLPSPQVAARPMLAAGAYGAAAMATGAGVGQYVEHVDLHVHNPLPEPTSESLPKAMRRQQNVLG